MKIREDKDNLVKELSNKRASNSRFRQGYYQPVHPEKYVGDINKIRYMSSWEKNVHRFLDCNVNVLRWGSEVLQIPYLKPTDSAVHFYYPDYWIEFVNADGEVRQEVWEVKPNSQTQAPKGRHRKVVYEHVQFAINVAKWEAAERWCKSKGMTFRLVTEKQIFR